MGGGDLFGGSSRGDFPAGFTPGEPDGVESTDRTTRAAWVQDQLDKAVDLGYSTCLIPESALPYDPTAVDFPAGDVCRPVRRGTPDETFDVVAYGAAGDWDEGTGSGTDDAPAINAATDAYREYARANPVQTQGDVNPNQLSAGLLYFPPKNYLVQSSIWLGTPDDQKDDIPRQVFGPGATLIGQVGDGTPVVDLTGAFQTRWYGLDIHGHDTSTPQVGVLLARNDTAESAGDHRFVDVTIFGNFNLAAVYNYASEWNRWVGGGIRVAEGSEAGIYCTTDNAEQGVTSPNTTLASGTQSMFGGFWMGVQINVKADPATATLGYAVVLEGVKNGPKFCNCPINVNRSDNAGRVFLFRAPNDTTSSGRAHGFVLRDCVVDTEYDILIDVSHDDVRGIVVEGNSMRAPAVTADLRIQSGARLFWPKIQTLRYGDDADEFTIQDNTGATFAVEPKMSNRGTASIASGTTSVNVTHHVIDGTRSPQLEDINVTPTSSLGAAVEWWVEVVDATTFQINVDADPTQTVTFAWSIDRSKLTRELPV